MSRRRKCNEAWNREGSKVAGVFEIAAAGDESYFFRLTAPDGTVVAVSPLFNTVKGAAAGITAVRENAATGLVVDRSARKAAGRSAAAARPAYQRPDTRRAAG